MTPDEPKGPRVSRRRPREIVPEQDIVRGSGARAVRRSRAGIREEDIVRSSRELSAMGMASPVEPLPAAVTEPRAVPLSVAPRAGWDEILRAAFGYDPMAIAGGLDRAIALADRVRAQYGMSRAITVTPREIAACLSFECRSFQHCGIVPQGDDLAYLGALYHAIAEHPP